MDYNTPPTPPMDYNTAVKKLTDSSNVNLKQQWQHHCRHLTHHHSQHLPSNYPVQPGKPSPPALIPKYPLTPPQAFSQRTTKANKAHEQTTKAASTPVKAFAEQHVWSSTTSKNITASKVQHATPGSPKPDRSIADKSSQPSTQPHCWDTYSIQQKTKAQITKHSRTNRC